MAEGGDRSRLHAHLRSVRRRWPIVALVTLLVIGAALAVSFTRPEVYRASTDVLVEPTLTDTNKQGVATITADEMATQVRVATSVDVAALVQTDLGLATAPDLGETVVAEPVGSSRILRLTASAPDGADAAALADAVASAYLLDRHENAQERYDATVGALTQRQARTSDRIKEIDDALAAGKGDRAALTAERSNLLVKLAQTSSALSDLEAGSNDAQPGGRVLTRAETPSAPVSPRPLIDGLLAALVGLLLGIGLALLRDRFDDVVHEADSVRGPLGRWPLLASIPRWEGARLAERLVTVLAPRSPAGEAFAGLGTNVRFLLTAAADGDDCARIAVMSSRSDEGKTTVAANLAVAVARVGVRVVLVEADLRRGDLGPRFGLDPGLPGLSERLLGDAEVEPIDVGIENLTVLPGGARPPNPTELMASSRMRTLLEELAKEADVLVLDVPPAIVADGLELVDVVDLTLVVARGGTSRRRELGSLVDRLEQLGARSIAGVLTGVATERSRNYTYAE